MAKKEHSITFKYGNTTKNTWDNWGLIPSSRPTMAQPTPVYKYVDIPGRSGSLDMTGYLVSNDKPTYQDRKGSFEFYVPNDGTSWLTRRSELASFFDGGKMKMILEDEPDYYYYGRIFFKDWKSDPQFSKVTIEYQVSPFRYKVSNDEEAGL